VNSTNNNKSYFSFVDLFCGIGGFYIAASRNGGKCVFACDIDYDARIVYEANFGIRPLGDITKIPNNVIPSHDMLCAGFPCQPFSIMGNRRGFDDVRGTLFFEIVRILQVKKPNYFVLENVKQLSTHNKGKTLARIIEILKEIGYFVDWKILNALDFGLPQKRERIIIVGFREPITYNWPKRRAKIKSLNEILEKNVSKKYFASKRIREKRKNAHKSRFDPAIWHENKSGNISSYPYSCALRAGASYNYLLVNGERRLTPREMLKLQGFPDTFKIVSSDSKVRKQAGNAVPVPIIEEVIREVVNAAQTEKWQQERIF